MVFLANGFDASGQKVLLVVPATDVYEATDKIGDYACLRLTSVIRIDDLTEIREV